MKSRLLLVVLIIVGGIAFGVVEQKSRVKLQRLEKAQHLQLVNSASILSDFGARLSKLEENMAEKDKLLAEVNAKFEFPQLAGKDLKKGRKKG